MSLLFCDGFRHVEDGYDNLKWDFYDVGVVYDSTYGSLGDPGMRISSIANQTIKYLNSNKGTLIVGVRIKLSELSDTVDLIRLYDDGTVQISLRAKANGAVAAYRGGVELVSSDIGKVSFGYWFYLEIKVTFSQTVGKVDVRLNERSLISTTANQDTCATANEYSNRVGILSNSLGSTTYFDDLYVADNSGSVNNDFLGDIRITTLYPTSDGVYAQFTPSTGTSHYTLVDDPQLVGDTDHVSSSTIGHKETYGVTDFSSTDNILGVQICAAVKNTDVGVMNVRTLCRSGAVPADNEGSDFTLSQTIRGYMTIHELEPTDAVAWTAAKINAAEFGLKVQS